MGGAALAGAAVPSLVGAGESKAGEEGLKSEFLLALTAELEPPQMIGKTPQGNRQVFYAKGGTFEGPKLKGTILPGGGDWLRHRPDGASELDVRATMQTDDRQLIYVHYRGIIHRPERGKGDGGEAAATYFRTTPVFETSSEKYSWLNRIISVGVGRSVPNGAAYRVYRIL